MSPQLKIVQLPLLSGRDYATMFEDSMSNQDRKAIFITGSSSGLDRATLKLFAWKGWRVIASMRDPKKEKELGNISGVTRGCFASSGTFAL
jgi:hypothetical protein